MSRCTDLPSRAVLLPSRGAVVRGAALCAAVGCAPVAELAAPEFPYLPPSTPCISLVERVAHLDQPSALGFSAVELLARVAGESASPLVWLPPEPNSEYELEYGPEVGLSNLRIQVIPAEGPVLYRHELLSDFAPDDTECADAVLEVPVYVSIQTGTQALEESFPARLQASSVYRAQFSHVFAPGSLKGGFAVTELSSLDPDRAFSAGPLSLQVQLWEGGSQGSLSTEIRSSVAAGASAAAREALPAPLAAPDTTHLALWPSAEPCHLAESSPLPTDARLLGFSVLDVLTALRQDTASELTWSSGTATALTLEYVMPASELCQSVGDALGFETTVRVRTLDGRLEAEVPVQINAANSGGSIGEITVQAAEVGDARALPVQATLTSVGRHGAKSHGPVHVDLDASYRSGASTGTLTLTSIESDASVPSSASVGAPYREIDSARW